MKEKLRSLEEENKTLKHDIAGLQQTTCNLPEVVTSDQFDSKSFAQFVTVSSTSLLKTGYRML